MPIFLKASTATGTLSGRAVLLPTATFLLAATPSALRPPTATVSGTKPAPRCRSASFLRSGAPGGSTAWPFWSSWELFMDQSVTGSIRSNAASESSNGWLLSAPKNCARPMTNFSSWPSPMNSPAWPITASSVIFLNMNGGGPAGPKGRSHLLSATLITSNSSMIPMAIKLVMNALKKLPRKCFSAARGHRT